MATKTTITSLINSNLADSSDILASEHRAVEIALLNAFYPTTQNETQATDVLTTADANFDYDLNFTKIGRLVHVTGTATNVSGSILGFGSNVFEFKTGEFYPNTTINQVFNSGGIAFSITASGELQALTSITVGDTIYFNFNYSTQD